MLATDGINYLGRALDGGAFFGCCTRAIIYGRRLFGLHSWLDELFFFLSRKIIHIGLNAIAWFDMFFFCTTRH